MAITMLNNLQEVLKDPLNLVDPRRDLHKYPQEDLVPMADHL